MGWIMVSDVGSCKEENGLGGGEGVLEADLVAAGVPFGIAG